jgi:hypothetical protein
MIDEVILVPGEAETRMVTSAGSKPTTMRAAFRFDDFAVALAAASGAAGRVENGRHLPRSSSGAILMCTRAVLDESLNDPVDLKSDAAARIVLLEMRPSEALEQAERWGLAAVVDFSEYITWMDGRPPGTGAELYGRQEIGQRLGATLTQSSVMRSERYALLSHPTFPDLPDLLGLYLREYVRTL